jgi:hypothetical protein
MAGWRRRESGGAEICNLLYYKLSGGRCGRGGGVGLAGGVAEASLLASCCGLLATRDQSRSLRCG